MKSLNPQQHQLARLQQRVGCPGESEALPGQVP